VCPVGLIVGLNKQKRLIRRITNGVKEMRTDFVTRIKLRRCREKLTGAVVLCFFQSCGSILGYLSVWTVSCLSLAPDAASSVRR